MHNYQTSDAKDESAKGIEKQFPKRFFEELMCTTVDIEEAVLHAAKEIARQRKITVGRVLSDLARRSQTRKPRVSKKHSLPLFPVQPDAGPVTLELVNHLRDEAP
jgi:hypothetical protein